MKLSELRACDNCNGVLAPRGWFYVVRLSSALALPREMNEVLGLNQFFGGNLQLAEAMAPNEQVIKVLGDEEKALMTELFICQECYLKGPIDLLAMLMEKRNGD